MENSKNKIELLAPAGNFEKLEIAIHYGADAVYLAGKEFSLRSFSGNFSLSEMKDAVRFAHKKNVKVYVACNIYSRNSEQPDLANYLKEIKKIKPDALIISDPGIFLKAKKIVPEIDIHLSTQANTTNYNIVKFWEELGVKRVNVARELSLNEISEISNKNSIEVEAFVHGAMCISHSGRCLLSSFFTKRDANRGLCSHPCRWKYALVEEKRPGQYIPVFEDMRGSYFFNSKDLCMIDHIPELVESGISSFKIEGRMKGINYLATVIKVYREAIDLYISSNEEYKLKQEWKDELQKISHRTYCKGFYFGDPEEVVPDYEKADSDPSHIFVGKVVEKRDSSHYLINVRNKISADDEIEVLSPGKSVTKDRILSITNDRENLIENTKQNTNVVVEIEGDYFPNDLIRKIRF